MARDNKLFQEALKRGSAHAWSEEWAKAAQEYRLALGEFPEDVSARTYLAMALYKSGELRESLALYSSLWNAQPSNLTMLQRVAELQEAVGEREAAAISYGRLADAHTRRRSPKDAFKAWQKVVELTPGNPLLWNSFVDVAVQAGMVKEVLPDYLGLARDLALRSRFQDAIQVVEKAVALDASNPLAVQLLLGIRRAMEYWFRATGLGETVLPGDLERLIPSLQTAEPHRDSVPAEPSALVIHPEDFPERPKWGDDRPAITVYASNVTLSMDSSGILSIRGDNASEAPPAEAEAAPESLPEPTAVSLPEPTAESLPEQTAESEPALDGEAGPGDELPVVAEDAGSEPARDPVEEVTEEARFRELPIEEYEALASEQVAGEGPRLDEVAGPEEVEDHPADEVPEVSEVPEISMEEPEQVEEPDAAGVDAIAEPGAPVAETVAEPEAIEPETAVGLEPVTPEPEAVVPEPEAEDTAPEDLAAPEDPDVVAESDDVVADWQQLMQEAEAARNSGELQRAIELFQQSLQTGSAVAQQFVELGKAQEQAGQRDEAAQTFAQALELSPDLPEALLGIARNDLSNHRLDAAERKARELIKAATEDVAGAGPAAVGLMLDIARERAAYGDFGGAVEVLAELRASQSVGPLPQSLVDRLEAAPTEIVGGWVAEHLQEITTLPKELRGRVASALWRTEKLIAEGKLRSAADEMYQVLAFSPEFLPAQSVLGMVLVAQGRRDEAVARAHRLLDLYELRDQQDGVLDVLLWMIRSGIGDSKQQERLLEGLRSRGRVREAEAIVLELAGRAESTAGSPAAVSTLEAVAVRVPVTVDEALRLAEASFAAGDVEGAASQIRSALQDDASLGAADRAALLRLLQMMVPCSDAEREMLVAILREMGLPEDLADR